MLALFNLHPGEILVGTVVAVLVFGRRLPEVAGQAAGQFQKFKRALTDLKRETGIEEELRSARRSLEEVVPREDWRRTLDAPNHFARELEREIVADTRAPAEPTTPATPPVTDPASQPPAAGSDAPPAPPGAAQ